MYKKYNAHKRHIAKAITWRIVGTVDTMALAWLLSGNPMLGFKIGVSELLTKITLYYLHERVWYLTKFGDNNKRHAQLRHVFKTITWRIVGTIDTMLLGWWLSGNVLLGVKLGGAEVITKMVLYYLHERAWYRNRYGIDTEKQTVRNV